MQVQKSRPFILSAGIISIIMAVADIITSILSLLVYIALWDKTGLIICMILIVSTVVSIILTICIFIFSIILIKNNKVPAKM